MTKKRPTGPGGEAEFSGGGGLDRTDLVVSVKFARTGTGSGGGASKVEHPGKNAVTITIPTRVVIKLLQSGGLRLGVEDTTIAVPIEAGDTVKVRWA